MSAMVPCKDCMDRTVGCHASCARYGKYREQKEQEAAYLKNDKIIADTCFQGKQRWKGARFECPRKGK